VLARAPQTFATTLLSTRPRSVRRPVIHATEEHHLKFRQVHQAELDLRLGVQGGEDPRRLVHQDFHVRGAILPSTGIAQVR
jgi:hypothetical protein